MKHTDIYFNALGYYKEDMAQCEICGKPATEIHHIERRGLGGTKNPESNCLANIMAICRECHIEYGDKVKYKRMLKIKHLRLITQRFARVLGIYQEVDFKYNQIIFKGENDETIG